MIKTLFSLILAALCLTVTAEPVKPTTAAGSCPVDGKPTDPQFTTGYEGGKYRFCSETCATKWKAEREASIYQQIGGKAAMDAAVELFYKKVLADSRIKHFFDDVDMVRQHSKQKAFLSAAFGGPIPWTGKDMRKAHEKLKLDESHFNAVAENLQATLTELKVKKELIDKVMTIAASTRDDVLNRKPGAK